jgi:hypothetical protein
MLAVADPMRWSKSDPDPAYTKSRDRISLLPSPRNDSEKDVGMRTGLYASIDSPPGSAAILRAEQRSVVPRDPAILIVDETYTLKI